MNNDVLVDGLIHIRALPQSQTAGDTAFNVETHLPAKKKTIFKSTEGAHSLDKKISMLYIGSREPSK